MTKRMTWMAALVAAMCAMTVGCTLDARGDKEPATVDSTTADDTTPTVDDDTTPTDDPAKPDDAVEDAECVLNSDCPDDLVCGGGACVDPGGEPVEELDAGVCVATNETCNDLDDDCDGYTDEGCPAPPEPTTDGGLVAVDGEVCENGFDDDGDGYIDEVECNVGTPAEPTPDAGAADAGTPPVEEACDGVDNDSDGVVDEGCAIEEPDAGTVPPTVDEVCENGLDDDEDGQIDEVDCGDVGGECTSDADCPQGSVCVLEHYVCVISAPPPVETCNGLDDDSDGLVDEECPPPPEPSVVIETCNGLDDDSDGAVDEGTCTAVGAACLLNSAGTWTCQYDTDSDSVGDGRDNCPNVANVGQADADSDGIGDACEVPLPPATVTLTVSCPTNDANCALFAWWVGRSASGTSRLVVTLGPERCAPGAVVDLNAREGGASGPWYSDSGRLGDLVISVGTAIIGQVVVGQRVCDAYGCNTHLVRSQLVCE